ncbi:MAG: glycosyltransferase family 2 protein [Magnetococcales bacterium]|nr:glycosyltransferase family 2 protein [Magnetococcales bacterium]
MNRCRLTLIIPTYHRQRELTDCLASVLRQTRKPEELIVVDDGNLPELPLQQELEVAGLSTRMVRKQTPGLTESRNLGLSLATGEIIGFLDDDVILEERCLEELLRVFEEDSEGRIGGVGGHITNRPAFTWKRRLRRLAESLFLLSGLREGRMRPSGFCVDFGDAAPLTEARAEVDFLPGAAFAFRRTVFERCRFTPGYRKLAFGEDKDFCQQVARHHGLILATAARLQHLEAAAMRPDKEREGRMFVMGRYLFFRRFLALTPAHWLFFGYAMFAYTLMRLTAFLLKPGRGKWSRLKGVFAAYGDILAGRVVVPFQDSNRR